MENHREVHFDYRHSWSGTNTFVLQHHILSKYSIYNFSHHFRSLSLHLVKYTVSNICQQQKVEKSYHRPMVFKRIPIIDSSPDLNRWPQRSLYTDNFQSDEVLLHSNRCPYNRYIFIHSYLPVFKGKTSYQKYSKEIEMSKQYSKCVVQTKDTMSDGSDIHSFQYKQYTCKI